MSAAREGFITDTSRPKAEQDAVTRFEAADAANTKAARAVLDDAQALVQDQLLPLSVPLCKWLQIRTYRYISVQLN